jgi:hypothetical protein
MMAPCEKRQFVLVTNKKKKPERLPPKRVKGATNRGGSMDNRL